MIFKFIGIDVKVIYVEFNDIIAGIVAMRHDYLAHQNNWVPIEKVHL